MTRFQTELSAPGRRSGRRRGAPPNEQHGAVLVIALIMVFMLSILGVSSMRDSTMEQRMAANAFQSSTALQLSESATELALNEPDNLDAAFELRGDPMTPVVDLQVEQHVRVDASVRYLGDGPAPGYSLGRNKFVALRFSARGLAGLDAVRSYSSVTQGAYRVVPGS